MTLELYVFHDHAYVSNMLLDHNLIRCDMLSTRFLEYSLY